MSGMSWLTFPRLSTTSRRSLAHFCFPEAVIRSGKKRTVGRRRRNWHLVPRCRHLKAAMAQFAKHPYYQGSAHQPRSSRCWNACWCVCQPRSGLSCERVATNRSVIEHCTLLCEFVFHSHFKFLTWYVPATLSAHGPVPSIHAQLLNIADATESFEGRSGEVSGMLDEQAPRTNDKKRYFAPCVSRMTTGPLAPMPNEVNQDNGNCLSQISALECRLNALIVRKRNVVCPPISANAVVFLQRVPFPPK